MIFLCIHVVLLAFGMGAAMLLLVAILKATPPTVKNYSVLLLWGACNDLVSTTADMMTLDRQALSALLWITARWPTFIYIPAGVCTKISLEFCNLCNSFFLSLMVQSVIIISVSFWLNILSNPPPSTLKLNMILIVLVIPHIAHMVFFTNVKAGSFHDPALVNTLQELYPLVNWTGHYAYGLKDIRETDQTAAWMYYFTVLPAMSVYLIITRHRAVRALNNHQSMSEKTYAMHRVFLKILTIHALLPLTALIAISSLFLTLSGVINEELEELVFLVGSITPVFMPSITIYFMKPYKEYLTRLLFPARMLQKASTIQVQSQNGDSFTKMSTVQVPGPVS